MPTLDAAQLKMGSESVSTAYLGTTKVWPKWTPANITTRFWYDATDASTITFNTATNEVTQVLDKSGNGYTLTRKSGLAGPKIGTRQFNGKNVFDWQSGVSLQNTSFTHAQATTPLYIAQVLLIDVSAVQYGLWALTTSVTAGLRMSCRWQESNNFQILGGSAGGANIAMGGGSAFIGTTYIIVPKLNSASSAWRTNGLVTNTGNVGTNACNLLLLGGNENGGFALDGFIAEMVGFTAANDVTAVEGYLAWKWGLQGSLPAAHAYKNFPP